MGLVEPRFFLPICEDADIGNGEIHPYGRWQKLETDLFVKYDGWTLSPGLYRGMYRDPDTGKPIGDLSKQYILAVEEERIPDLRQYLKEHVAVLFRQKVIYLFNGREVELLTSIEMT